MKTKIIHTLVFFITSSILISCEPHSHYMEFHGNPTYKVTLLNINGNPIDTKYAHEKYESTDWGMHKNYEFRYWRWKWNDGSDKYGIVYLESWEWDKSHVIIERGNYPQQ